MSGILAAAFRREAFPSVQGRHMGIWTKTRKSIPSAAQPLDDRKIEISPADGVIRVLDPRIFREDRRGWCRSLADSAAGSPAVRSLRIDLEAAACEVRFVAELSAHDMAGVLAASMRAAD